jgi:hypothetical protein
MQEEPPSDDFRRATNCLITLQVTSTDGHSVRAAHAMAVTRCEQAKQPCDAAHSSTGWSLGHLQEVQAHLR